MIERLLQRAFELLILLVVVSFLVGALPGLLHQWAGAMSVVGSAIPRLVADVVATLLTGTFCVGLAVRIGRAVTGHGRHGGRDRDAPERQARVAVRRPAVDVPAIPTDDGPAHDPDPALELGNDE
jgi:hypothetical protein